MAGKEVPDSQVKIAQKTWEMSNNVLEVSSTSWDSLRLDQLVDLENEIFAFLVPKLGNLIQT